MRWSSVMRWSCSWLRRSYWTASDDRPLWKRRRYASPKTAIAMSTSSTSHGHSGWDGSPITSSTTVRAISGTIACPALPRTAATNEIWTSRLCFQT